MLAEEFDAITVRQVLEKAKVPIPVASRMFAGALVELLRWSLDRDATHSPAWVDARYHEVVWLGLGGAPS